MQIIMWVVHACKYWSNEKSEIDLSSATHLVFFWNISNTDKLNKMGLSQKYFKAVYLQFSVLSLKWNLVLFLK